MIAKEESDFVKVDALQPHLRNVNVTVKVLDMGKSRFVTSRRDYTVHNVTEAVVGDETGCVVLTLWDQQIHAFQTGDVVEVRNGYTSRYRGFLRLNVGRHGKAETVEKEMEEINTENNLSEERHEAFGRRRTY